MTKELPPIYSSWRQFYDDIVSKYPDVLRHRKIVLKWIPRNYNGNPSDIVEHYTFSIYLDTLKKKCFEESLEKV